MHSTVIYVLLGLLLMFLVLYIWRRIYGLQSYTHILEKKIANLRKENRELRKSDESVCNQDEAEIIMNKIFCSSEQSCVSAQPTTITLHTVDVPLTVPTSSPVVTPQSPDVFDTDVLLKNIIEQGQIKHIQEHQESAEDVPDVSDVLDITEIESVISDAPYNKRKLSKMNLDKLKEICIQLKISSDGTKNTLIERILSQ